MEGDELVYLCALNRVLLFKPQVVRKILEAGLLKEIFAGKSGIPEELFPDGSPAAGIKDPGLLERTRKDLEWMREKGVKVLSLEDESYPGLLKECRDAPPVLYYRGSADLNVSRSVSAVGTRLASFYGKECSRNMMEHFAENGYDPLVVSGLAYGIDIYVHRAALECGLKTVAVLPCGIDTIYPASHRDTAARMTVCGGIVTEFPPGTPPLKIHFIKRNRIIAGMTQGLIVVESRIKGGAMSTVEFAAGYGRDIFAVPGRMEDVNSYGCNYLISKNIACICNHCSVIPDVLNWNIEGSAGTEGQPQLFSGRESGKEKILLSLKNYSAADIDRICRETGLSLDTAAVLLLELELEGKLKAVPGNNYCLVK